MVSLLLLGTLCVSSTMAQPPGGPPDGPPPGGGFPGGPPGRRPGPPPIGPPRHATVVDVPVAVLDAGLQLSADQKTKISQIQRELRKQRRDLMPKPDEQTGAPPTQQAMQAAMRKQKTLNDQVTQQITTILTTAQQQALPAFLKELDAYHMLGIPPDVLGELKLTADQKKSLLAIADAAKQAIKQNQDAALQNSNYGSYQKTMQDLRRKTHDQAMTVLTADQQTVVEDFVQAHPGPPPPGGPGDGNGPPPPGPPDNN